MSVVLLDGHRSASQRREASLRSLIDHLNRALAIVVLQQGGTSILPAASLAQRYHLAWKEDRDGTLTFTSELLPESAGSVKVEEPDTQPVLVEPR